MLMISSCEVEQIHMKRFKPQFSVGTCFPASSVPTRSKHSFQKTNHNLLELRTVSSRVGPALPRWCPGPDSVHVSVESLWTRTHLLGLLRRCLLLLSPRTPSSSSALPAASAAPSSRCELRARGGAPGRKRRRKVCENFFLSQLKFNSVNHSSSSSSSSSSSLDPHIPDHCASLQTLSRWEHTRM